MRNTILGMMKRAFPMLAVACVLIGSCCATGAPDNGDCLFFRSDDGRFLLSAVRIPAADPKGVVVVVGGRSESWLEYGRLFRDLHRAGYTVYSYDHRGQGLSPHLLPQHPQIGHVDDFRKYPHDLGAFLREIHHREGSRPVNLIGHSMGATVITEYLAHQHTRGVGKVVLCSPMFRINTSPWPEPLARLVLELLHLAGKGACYAPGEHDAQPDEPFGKNRVTSSPDQWQETLAFRRHHPEAVTGGASVDWVGQALSLAPSVRKDAERLGPETLILLAGRDDLVIPWLPLTRDGNAAPSVMTFPDARHEILRESDPIRDGAIGTIIAFLKAPVPQRPRAITLDRMAGNGHTSVTKQTPP